MGAVKCRACGQGESVAICSESGIPICANCAVSCAVCEAPVNRALVQLTSTGRKLCTKCMAERNDRRRAKKEEMRREASAAKKEPARSKPAAAGVAGASFEDLMRDDAELSQAFKGIVREEVSLPAAPVETSKPAGTSFEDLESKPAAPQKKGSKSAARQGSDLDPNSGLGNTFGLEGQPQEGSKRLSLGPIDDNRPILSQSGHQPPSRKAYIAAFCLFGLAGAIFFKVAPGFRDVLFPGHSTTPAFMSGEMAQATDTNALRNASNISLFDTIKESPITLVAWLVVGSYMIGFILIVWSVGRSMLSSYLAKRRLKKAEEYAKKHGYSYPG